MDISKLPRKGDRSKPATGPQSIADQSPPAHVSTPPPSLDYRTVGGVRPGVGAEVWLSLIIGGILMMLGFRFARFAMATLAGQPFHTQVTWTSGPKQGQEVAYFELANFVAWTEMGIFIFGLALVLQAAMLAVVYSRLGGKMGFTAMALIVALLATGLNLYVCAKLLGAGVMPLLSALAVAFGGYIAILEWKLLQQLRQHRATVQA